jgi:TolA-binding protein
MARTKRRLTKHDIRQRDQFAQSMLKFSAYARKHVWLLIGGLVVIILVVSISSTTLRKRHAASEESLTMLATAVDAYYMGAIDESIALSQKILEAYPRSYIAERALYFLASAYYTRGEYQFAEENFQRYLDRNPNDELFVPSAMSGIAACYESRGDFAGAAEIYEEVADTYPDAVVTPEALLSAARCREEIGEYREAERIYQRILDTYPMTEWARLAYQGLNLVKGAQQARQQ